MTTEEIFKQSGYTIPTDKHDECTKRFEPALQSQSISPISRQGVNNYFPGLFHCSTLPFSSISSIAHFNASVKDPPSPVPTTIVVDGSFPGSPYNFNLQKYLPSKILNSACVFRLPLEYSSSPSRLEISKGTTIRSLGFDAVNRVTG